MGNHGAENSQNTTSLAYQYSPLNEHAQEIRLLTLLPRKSSPSLRIILSITSLTDSLVPKFEALSYTWGPPTSPSQIYVGESGSYTLSVTQNLAEALPYLQDEHEPRVFWIDAVCVNQQDLPERGSQVKRMAEIYSKATRVVIWLGPELEDSKLGLETLNYLSRKIDIDQWHTVTPVSEDPSEAHWADLNRYLALDDAQSKAISALVNRSWFERLWIWQEFA